ncbi:MAG: tRNA-dihydrouridine synthase, partial [Anaerolineales bacterium]
MTEKAVFYIGNVPIYGDLILAPMDGISDMPFRGLCRELGSAMSVTEFINTLDVLEGNPRYLPRLSFEPNERPLALQLL